MLKYGFETRGSWFVTTNAVRQIGALILRHQFVIWDISVIVGAGALLLVLGIEYDLLLMSGLSQADAERLELGELLLVVLVLSCGWLSGACGRKAVKFNAVL
jgi:hypothetical protein